MSTKSSASRRVSANSAQPAAGKPSKPAAAAANPTKPAAAAKSKTDKTKSTAKLSDSTSAPAKSAKAKSSASSAASAAAAASSASAAAFSVDSVDSEMPAEQKKILKSAKLMAEKSKEKTPGKSKSAAAAARAEAEADGDGESAVIYIGHIPHGFFETELHSFFSQFGQIAALRLSRSRVSGNSRGFAFIKFLDAAVADIAAHSMDRYMMFGKTLRCELLASDRVHPNLFDGADRKFRKIPWAQINREKVNKIGTAEEQRDRTKSLRKNEAARKRKFEKLGLAYEFTGFDEEFKLKNQSNQTNETTASKSMKKQKKENQPESVPVSATESKPVKAAAAKKSKK